MSSRPQLPLALGEGLHSWLGPVGQMSSRPQLPLALGEGLHSWLGPVDQMSSRPQRGRQTIAIAYRPLGAENPGPVGRPNGRGPVGQMSSRPQLPLALGEGLHSGLGPVDQMSSRPQRGRQTIAIAYRPLGAENPGPVGRPNGRGPVGQMSSRPQLPLALGEGLHSWLGPVDQMSSRPQRGRQTIAQGVSPGSANTQQDRGAPKGRHTARPGHVVRIRPVSQNNPDTTPPTWGTSGSRTGSITTPKTPPSVSTRAQWNGRPVRAFTRRSA